MTTRPRRIRLTRVLALIAAGLVIWHGVSQGAGAVETWRPCFEEGFDSRICLYLQYEAPSPGWVSLFLLWPVEMVLAVATAVTGGLVRHRRAIALSAGALVLVSNIYVDYGMAPIVNGGYVSADSAPGFGYFGAGCLVVAGVLFLLVGVLPRRQPSTMQSREPQRSPEPAASAAA